MNHSTLEQLHVFMDLFGLHCFGKSYGENYHSIGKYVSELKRWLRNVLEESFENDFGGLKPQPLRFCKSRDKKYTLNTIYSKHLSNWSIYVQHAQLVTLKYALAKALVNKLPS